MSKRRNEESELDHLQNLARLSEDDKLRKIRELEHRLATVSAANKDLDAKYKQAEADLRLTESNIERMLATQDEVTVKKLESSKKRPGKGHATAIICVNDWHCEENVDPDVVGGMNKFNPSIAEKRIAATWEKAVYLLDFARGISNIEEVVIWAGGDLINGYIHEEMQEANFSGPTEACLFVQDQLASGIDLVRKKTKIPQLTFLANYGNHGRSTPKKRISTGWKTSWEWFAYHNVARYFQRGNSKLNTQIAKGPHLRYSAQGHDIRFHHGDSVKFGGGMGGVHIPLRKKIAQWNKTGTPAKLDVLGHFHQFAHSWDYVLCGSLVGYNAYAIEIGADYQPPTQTFIVVDREHGKVMALPIFCDDKLVN